VSLFNLPNSLIKMIRHTLQLTEETVVMEKGLDGRRDVQLNVKVEFDAPF
jgi:hypothetical protein